MLTNDGERGCLLTLASFKISLTNVVIFYCLIRFSYSWCGVGSEEGGNIISVNWESGQGNYSVSDALWVVKTREKNTRRMTGSWAYCGIAPSKLTLFASVCLMFL